MNEDKNFEIGMVGLGVMGRNLALNMADHGHSVAGYDQDPSKIEALQDEAGDRRVQGAGDVEEFVELLRTPRAVMILVPAGPPVDSVIHDVLPYLEEGDLIIDGGNSHFPDTDLRAQALAEKGIQYLGVGISGGESGARHGPSMMPGGPRESYERVRPIFEASAAHVNGDPCVTYLGPGSAGHYVKMVHNGIEYGLMQLIAESYDLMKRGFGLSDDELHDIYALWNRQELSGYLMEITASIFARKDEATGGRLIDVILDAAKQKGTGMWSSQDAMELGVPVPTIDIAVAMRNLSAFEEERSAASRVLRGPDRRFQGDLWDSVGELRNALYAAMITTYAQGLAQLRVASQEHEYGLDLEAVARIWRGGCIIRAALLEDIRAAYKASPDLPNLLLDSDLGQAVVSRQEDLRAVVRTAADLAIPTPGLMVSLAYFDGYRSDWLPANLIQAQRDYFGAHTYERIDQKGTFHTQWTEQ
jgi:6-phosphogluconate dehydrogenase